MTSQGNAKYTFTRREQLDFGFLVDVTAEAKGYGFRVPVAFTEVAWQRCVAVDALNPTECSPAEYGGILNVLAALRRAIHETGGKGAELSFDVECRRGPGEPLKSVPLVAAYGPGDDGELVLTLWPLNEEC